MRKAVRVESNRKAILFVGATGILKLLTLTASEIGAKRRKGGRGGNWSE